MDFETEQERYEDDREEFERNQLANDDYGLDPCDVAKEYAELEAERYDSDERAKASPWTCPTCGFLGSEYSREMHEECSCDPQDVVAETRARCARKAFDYLMEQDLFGAAAAVHALLALGGI